MGQSHQGSQQDRAAAPAQDPPPLRSFREINLLEE